ncbi:HIT-type Zinc finger family protein isoform 2, partial [Theobroma cacao]
QNCHYPPHSSSGVDGRRLLQNHRPLPLVSVAFAAMDDENSNPFRRMSSRTRKVAPKMAAALASSDNRTQLWPGLKLWRMITQGLKQLNRTMMMKLLLMTMIKHTCKRGPRAQNVKPDRQKHLKMLGRLREHFLSSYTRQTWNPCLLMFHPI